MNEAHDNSEAEQRIQTAIGVVTKKFQRQWSTLLAGWPANTKTHP